MSQSAESTIPGTTAPGIAGREADAERAVEDDTGAGVAVGVAASARGRVPGTEVDGVSVLGALSPSRAGDFLSCPLLYRFRSIDRLPERTSPDAVRGTLVHKVLEELFDLPAAERTLVRAEALVEPTWRRLREVSTEVQDLFDDDTPATTVESWLARSAAALARYFTLEDPTRLEPGERELYVESVLDSRLLLRGIVDRVDVAPDGALRIVDYKTGRAPAEGHEARALFQLRIYALILWRVRGVVPRMLQLVYLGSGELVRYEPDELDLLATQRKVEAVWAAIRLAEETGDWQPHRSRLCDWCSFRDLCPEFGGTPPPLPERAPPPAAVAVGSAPRPSSGVAS